MEAKKGYKASASNLLISPRKLRPVANIGSEQFGIRQYRFLRPIEPARRGK